MRLAYRVCLLLTSPPPWLTLLVGVVLGGVLTSTFTFSLWWCDLPTNNGHLVPLRILRSANNEREIVTLPQIEIVTYESLPSKELHSVQLPSKESTSSVSKEVTTDTTPLYLNREFRFRKQLLVAIVTSGTHLHSASSLYDTWGAEASQILFFVGKDCNSSNPYSAGLPLVRLTNVPDLPTNSIAKTFATIKYIYENYGNDFRWFLLANDNLYVRTSRLGRLLDQLDPSESIYLGRPARGKEGDAQMLSLLPHEHYCLGSTGVVLSHKLLHALSSNLEFCLNAVLSAGEKGGRGFSSHADVEIGRCVSRQLGVQCSRASQTKTFFFEDYSGQPLTLKYLEKTSQFDDLITYHPVPAPSDMFTIHYHYKRSEFKSSLDSAQSSREKLKGVCKSAASLSKAEFSEGECEMSICPCESDHDVQDRCPSAGVVTNLPVGYQPSRISDFQTWHYFDDRAIYMDKNTQPSYWFHTKKDTRRELQEMLTRAVQAASDKYGRKLKFKKIVNGWVRHNPSKGSEYIVDCLFIDGYRRVVSRRVNFVRPLATNYITQKDNGDPQATVAFVVPVAKVNDRFREFMEMYENVGLRSKERVKLVLAVYGSEDVSFVNKVLEPLRDRYPEASITVVEGKGDFSRGRALHLGMTRLYPEELAFICDVDMTVSQPFLERCRKNTVKGKRVYYPEFFKLYNLDYVYRGKRRPSRISMKRSHGHWAYYSYGMLCIYRSDYDSVGGMNTNIKGWGDEDVEFFEKVLRKRLNVLRAPDTALSHRWHEKNCPKTLASKQLKHCYSSRGENLADRIELANFIYEKGVQLKYSTSLPSYSPQLVVYGNETEVGEAGAEEDGNIIDSDEVYT